MDQLCRGRKLKLIIKRAGILSVHGSNVLHAPVWIFLAATASNSRMLGVYYKLLLIPPVPGEHVTAL